MLEGCVCLCAAPQPQLYMLDVCMQHNVLDYTFPQCLAAGMLQHWHAHWLSGQGYDNQHLTC